MLRAFIISGLPDVLNVEQWFSPDTVQCCGRWDQREIRAARRRIVFSLLERRGGIAVDPKSGERLGASDYRSNGKAWGY